MRGFLWIPLILRQLRTGSAAWLRIRLCLLTCDTKGLRARADLHGRKQQLKLVTFWKRRWRMSGCLRSRARKVERNQNYDSEGEGLRQESGGRLQSAGAPSVFSGFVALRFGKFEHTSTRTHKHIATEIDYGYTFSLFGPGKLCASSARNNIRGTTFKIW